ncbi:MAG: hypothetical protein CMJ33_02050 [Phycisphaerae bacterium]|nr:hypothetical protein [Phycisphaerae bacterium]HAW95676.1 hypothetical protein [Phycisphaerales bacterium]
MKRRSFTSLLPFYALLRTSLLVGFFLGLLWLSTEMVHGRIEPIEASNRTAAGTRDTPDERGSNLIMVTAILAGSIIIILSWRRALRNHREFRRLLEGATRFSNNDLAFRIQATGEPQWDRLSICMNRMARTLEDQLGTLRRERTEQNAILQSMANAVLAIDTEHRLMTCNRSAERLFGLDDQAEGRMLEEVLREPGIHGLVNTIFEGGELKSAEFESNALPGRRLSVLGQLMFSPTNEPLGAVLIVDDVTDIRRLERMRSDFAANVSHELRTPITSIQGYAETLEELGSSEPEQTNRFLGIIRRNADRLAVIIEDLLTLSRLEGPGQLDEATLESMSVQHLFVELRDRVGRQAETHEVTLDMQAPEGLEFFSRGELVVEALSNLISNAIRYGPDGGCVTVEASRVEDTIRFMVRDEGPGIPERHLPRLFERFYRVDTARSRSAGGTGLGLAIVKHIALAHGGDVAVESEIGVGSTFTLQIPHRSDERPIPNDSHIVS